MTIQQCRYVLEIAKTGSFSEAAKQLFIAQSSLSVGIKSLEKELGIQIFTRSGNGVFLTEEGSEFINYARQICNSYHFIAERYGKSARQKLHIATQHYDFIADIFGAFLQKTDFESYRFSIREIETYNVIRDVETAYSDIGILAIKESNYDIMKRYLGRRNLFFTPILTVKPHVFLQKGHPLAACETLTCAELKSYPYVSYSQGEHSGDYFTEELMDATYADKCIEISDRATLMNVLLLTHSYTIGTGIMPSALNKGDIVSIPLESDDTYVIGYILNQQRKLSALTKDFIRCLETTLKNM